ncbi:hypothetical protein IPU70_30735 [Achromobacter sp. SD115]|uniref:hypothetical protein n=1 Tax=Achromobacter sp. SD115 TaxID=2782011 RepID=UPI001A95C234|nr:hypothetical protein [Achromobacter sp. SD115]MBO1017968.1 hypothetical protein [Achromobacter sp. SD115]
MELKFNVHGGNQTRQVTPKELQDYALMYGLETAVAGRYSSLFILNLMLLEQINGIDPFHVIEELKFLEGQRSSLQTKPASQFKGEHLKGLWHKHFMPALPSVMAHNITNHLGKNGTRKIVEEVLDPTKSPVVTRQMIEELSNRIVFESMNERGGKGKFTGEWIVFAKENSENYYLGIWSHTARDEIIASSIKAACMPEFPFLAKYFA